MACKRFAFVYDFESADGQEEDEEEKEERGPDNNRFERETDNMRGQASTKPQ